ncbi:LacI family DNA-binding transcriptional regulator [Tessaracoccus sp.]|uniref:LacI family DNA-binding transcriptional regulator n=1 Tax=Tessaracoccus sp. TaxID=1971211 RepID=UPI002631D745|nr:LacI family DNA-binding transcriptional regulator [Tessaracoccus sp.]
MREAGGAPPTLEDVARAAGVSRATVSRVVNGGTLVSSDTVRVVSEAIDALGYKPNRAARALVTNKAQAVAVVVTETDDRVFSDPFFPQSYHGALHAFRGMEVQVLLAMAQPGESPGQMTRYLHSGHIDGAIVVSHHGPELAKRLVSSRQPVVFVGDPEVPGLPYVDLDQHAASVAATRHLIGRGAQRIATITGPQDMRAGVQRLAGFVAAMTEAGLPPAAVAHGDFTVRGGEDAARELLVSAPDVDAVFVASDLMALGAVRTLQAAGRRVPDDVAVVGFDDSSAALQSSPQLTTMTNPASELTRLAAEMLKQLLDGAPSPEPVILCSRLVVRDSA